MKDKVKKKNYAKTTNLDIRPIIESDDHFNYFFRKRIFAQKKLSIIRERYIIDRKNKELSTDEVILWVRNFDVDQEDRLAGYKGNFAHIYIKEVDPDTEDPDGNLFSEKTYTLCIEKLDRPVHKHPQRSIVKHRHPNWGHPILREIKNKPEKIYTHFEATSELNRLHDTYPDVSIPVRNRLYIMVYSKEKEREESGNNKPIQKIILEIKEVGEEQFKIEWRPNPVEGILERDKINMVSFSFFSYSPTPIPD